MIKRDNRQEIFRQIGPVGQLLPLQIESKRDELPHTLQRYMHILGPSPKRCLEMFADLGLSDPEIARYFKIPTDVVTELRQVWRIGCVT